MSDFSLLYKKYNSVSNLTNDLNNSIITLKRKNLYSDPQVREQHPSLQVSEEAVIKAQNDIAEILTALQDFYENRNTNNELYELMDNSLFQNQILHNAEFKHQILDALNKLKNNDELNSNDLANIDMFISVLDNEAGVLFRKLRTNRG